MNRGKIVFISLLLAFAIVVVGCGRKEEVGKKPAKVVKKVVKKKVKKTKVKSAEARGEVEFQGYTAVTLRDPFVPFIREKVIPLKKRRAALTPLERYDLGELRLVGILVKGKERYGLIEDSEGKGYTVRVGMRIGKNSGTIVKITNDSLIIEEEFLDISGKRVKKEKRLTLPKPGGE